MALAVAASGLDDHGKHARFVTGHDKRKLPVDRYFGLEQLLAGSVHICSVSERHIAAELFLDGDAGCGVAEGAEVVGIDLYGAGPKQLLYSIADCSVKGAAEQCVGGGIRNSLLLLLGVKALLVCGVAESEKRDNIRFGQRRIAAISNAIAFAANR